MKTSEFKNGITIEREKFGTLFQGNIVSRIDSLKRDRIGLGDRLTFDSLSFVQRAKGTLVKSGNDQLAFFNGVQANQLNNAATFATVELSQLTAAANVLLKI